jgi:tripartite-type tricarboxylate transporter receptor subunit TctC
MRSLSRSIAVAALAGLASIATIDAARAQAPAWPARPVRIVVPAPPGGGYDSSARLVAQDLARQLGQPFVIENKPGAGNIIGGQVGANAFPDGYTLSMTGMINTIAQGMYGRVPFDIVTDFVHIAAIGASEQWLVVNSQAGITSLADLIAQAKREPGKLSYATSGQGSTGHLVMELLQKVTGTSLTHIPYKGGAPALQDVLAELVPMTVIPPGGALQYIQAGKLKVLAVSGAHRSKDLPQVATFEELGYKQLTVASWVGLSAPKGTPSEVVNKLSAAVRASLEKPELVAQLEKLGLTPMVMTPQQYTQLVKSETERWGELTRSLNLKAN